MLGFNLYSLMFPKAWISYWLALGGNKKRPKLYKGNSIIGAEPSIRWLKLSRKIDYHFGAMFGWNRFRRLRRSFMRRLSMPIHQIGNRKMVEPLPFTHTRKGWRIVHLLTLLDFEVRWMGLKNYNLVILHVSEAYGTGKDFKRTSENHKVLLFWLLFFSNRHVEPAQMRPPCPTPMK